MKRIVRPSVAYTQCTLIHRAGGLSLRQDDLTGGTGLNMNYSIIFTEISFYPETSILLQMIGIIHMTNWIKPELDR